MASHRRRSSMMKKDNVASNTQESKRRGDPGGLWSRPAVRKSALSLLLIVAVLGAGIGHAWWLASTRPEARRRDVASLPPLVEVQTLVPEDIQQVFVGYGSARADQEVVLAVEVSGQIVEIGAGLKDGSAVARDQVLVRIDDRQYDRLLARAAAQLADADAQLQELEVQRANAERLVAIARPEVEVTRSEYKRLTDLYERQVASKKEWDFARLATQRSQRELQALENEVALIEPQRAKRLASRDVRSAEKQLAELDLERCTIRAPFTGRIEEFFVEVGDRVPVGGAVLRMISPRYIEVPIELPASAYARAKVGMGCVLTMDSLPGARWEATVSRLSPRADERSRTFTAYMEVDNAEQTTPLVPGYFLTANVKGPMLRQVLAIPRGAMVGGQVFVVNDDKVHARTARIDTLIGDRAVVSGDLMPGDRVVLTNLDLIRDGVSVRCRARTMPAQVAGDPDVGESDE